MNISEIIWRDSDFVGANWGHSGDADDYSTLEWKDTTIPKPTEAELQAKWDTKYAAIIAIEDIVNARQYPPIGDQLDMIFHAGLGGGEFQAAIQAVKDKYPK